MDIKQIRANMFALRGVAALNKNDWDAARKNFEASYAQDPESAFALNNLGYLAERDGELETALSFYARAQRASDSTDRVGMASEATAQGHRLAALAAESHRNVDLALDSKNHTSAPSSGPVELLRRDGTAEPPLDAPAQPAAGPPPPTPSGRQQN